MQRSTRDCANPASKGQTAGIRQIWLAIAWLAAVFSGSVAAPAAAQTSDAYTVRDIQVQKTSASGLKAQQEAVRSARDQALAHLFRRLVPKASHGAIPVLPPKEVDALVVATDVQEEQITSFSYTAVLALSFQPSGVRAALAKRNLAFADQPTPPLLVVPVFESAGTRLLWETPNPWDSAWRERVGAQGLVKTVMAAGNPSERLVLGPEQALNGDASRLQSLGRNYGASGALVAYARFRIDPVTATPSLDTEVKGFGAAPAGPFAMTVTDPQAADLGIGEASAFLAKKAAQQLSAAIEEAWKQQNLRRPTAPGAVAPSVGGLLATLNFSHLGDFGAMQRQLREIPAISSVSVASVTAKRAIFRLVPRTSERQMLQTIQNYGLPISQQGSEWVLGRN